MKELFYNFAPLIFVSVCSVIWLIAFYYCCISNLRSILVAHIITQLFLFFACGVIIKDLYQKANRDCLTGVYNRRSFFSKMPVVYKIMLPVSLMMIDIDNFKRINDTYGHQAGDQVLTQFADILKSNARKEDMIVRLGGEEFAVVLPQTCKENAVKMAERIKRAVEEKNFTFDYVSEKITVSIGIVTTDFPMNTDILLKYADKALYKAKEIKNMVVAYEQLELAKAR